MTRMKKMQKLKKMQKNEEAQRFEEEETYGVGAFPSEDEDEDEDEESEGSEEEEILNKSRTALFGQQNVLNRRNTEPTPRPSSPGGGSDSYLSETRCVHCITNISLMLLGLVSLPL